MPELHVGSLPVKWQVRDLILEALQADGVTQADLALAVGRTEKHVSQVLTGKAGISFDLAEEMLAALDRQLVVSVKPFPSPGPKYATLVDDGSGDPPALVHGDEPLTPEVVSAMRALIRAAKAYHTDGAAADPVRAAETARRQEAAVARVRRRAGLPVEPVSEDTP
jgi:transcriptional regulator with XRE-family HTH domain